MYDFLKKVPLFADLPDVDLERLCEMVDEVHLPRGQQLFEEGDQGDRAYVIRDGQIEIIKKSGDREVMLALRESGEVIGEMSLLESAPRMASARARTDSTLLAITQEQLDYLINSSSSAARAILHTFAGRLRATNAMLRESEKLAQLGTMTAGLAHELNNPAAATKRGAEQLRDAIDQLQSAQMKLSMVGLNDQQKQMLEAVEQQASHREGHEGPILELSSLERSDREYEIESWLEEHDIDNAWTLSPNLVNLGFDLPRLEDIHENFSPSQLPAVLEWLCNTYAVYSLLDEIYESAGRMSEIIKSLKMYVYLDQAPVQAVDVHEGLNNTLVMLRYKLKGGIQVERDFSPDLPKIQAYGSELNQVWTNLIDNAVDAMDGKGKIFIHTYQDGQFVVVEIEDNGPGIPETLHSKIFDPFFTTKPPGKGTGLGLHITNQIILKHGGMVRVFSRPGRTVFEVRLPINFESIQPGAENLNPVHRPTDVELRHILETYHTVAVVGISDKPDRPAHRVPVYLQNHGYTIIPVNPTIESFQGQKVYPNLKSIPQPVEIVQIFRRSEAVPEVVQEAIEIGAKVVWMQEGIINEEAALEAQKAGLKVVMDTCMRVQHRRLLGGDN